MSTSLGEQAIVGTLLATQLGTETSPVKYAYIDNVVPVPAATLQQVCDQGNTTDTGITVTAGDINVSLGAISALTDISAGGNITADVDLEAQNGNITAPNGTVTCGNGVTAATGDITATTGDIVATAGDIVATAGDVIVTAGKVQTFSGNIETGSGDHVVNGSGDFRTIGSGDFICASGDITATAGGVLAAAGNSQLNRIQWTGYFGGTSASSPIGVTPQSITPLHIFTMPSDTYNLTVFLTNTQPGAQEFAFEVHDLPSRVLENYQVVMTTQTYDNGGGASMGFNGIVIGESISAPTDSTKITCIFNVASPYAAQKIKCNVRFEYSRSPP